MSRPRPGETANGDTSLHREEPDTSLTAVIDGLGHGEGAAQASTLARNYLRDCDLATPLPIMVSELHGRLRGSRGVAATIVLARAGTVQVVGVGNVEVRFERPDFSPLLTAGILGSRLGRLRTARTELRVHDRFLLASDGIKLHPLPEDLWSLSPQAGCEQLMRERSRPQDDATVLLAEVVH